MNEFSIFISNSTFPNFLFRAKSKTGGSYVVGYYGALQPANWLLTKEESERLRGEEIRSIFLILDLKDGKL